MKKVLKKRPVAILITIAVICLTTLFSIQRTLGAECEAITDGFFTGVYYDGYARSSASSHLLNSAAAANGLLAIAANYDGLEDKSESLQASRDLLLDTLKTENIGDISSANQSMKSAFSNLVSAILQIDLSDRDTSGVQLYTDNFHNAQNAVLSSKYNDSVREFYRSTLDVFPTNFLSALLPNTPELFE